MADDLPEEEYERLFADAPPLTGGPGIRVRREDGGWVRPHPGRLAKFPRQSTLARIVCHRTKHRPTLLAVVVGPTATHEPMWVFTTDQNAPIGEDMLAPCQCGWDHVIDGKRLRSFLAKAARTKRRSSTWLFIDITEVSRDHPGA